MRLDKFTTKFQEALSDAQSLALGNDHAYIEPVHVLLEHGHQQVDGLDVGVVMAQRNALGVAQGFLKLGGEFVETHGPYPPNCRALEAVCA